MLKSFNLEGKESVVDFIETMKVAEGVECDVYRLVGDASKDLGIIRIKAGYKTPLQKVLQGERTIEGYISGKGKLTVTRLDRSKDDYVAKKGLAVNIGIGQLMQWQAAADSDLEVYEICFPPYKAGRFENLK